MRTASGCRTGEPGRVKFTKHSNHNSRIVLLIDGVPKLRRPWEALGVPTDMLAGEVDASVGAVKRQHFLILREHGLKLLVELRVWRAPFPAKVGHDLRDKPRPAIGA